MPVSDQLLYSLDEEEFTQRLKGVFIGNLDGLEDILARWTELRQSPSRGYNRACMHQIKQDILASIALFQGDVKLIYHLNMILPPKFGVSCHPDDSGTAPYFLLYSNSPAVWGEIFSTSGAEQDDAAEGIFSLDDLNIALSNTTCWTRTLEESKRDGWFLCLLDLLSWEIEFHRLEIGFREMILRIQLELVKEAECLPFTVYLSDALTLEESPIADGPVPNTYPGTFCGHPVWVQYITSTDAGGDETTGIMGKLSPSAIQAALAFRNLQHINLLSWTCIQSSDPERWLLVTPALVSNLQMLYKGKWKRDDRFKLLAIKDISEGLSYLHRVQRSHGDLIMCNVFLDGRNRCILGRLQDNHSKPQASSITGQGGSPQAASDSFELDAKAFGSIICQMYPQRWELPAKVFYGGLEETRTLKHLVAWILPYYNNDSCYWWKPLRDIGPLIGNVLPRLSLSEPEEQPEEETEAATLTANSPQSVTTTLRSNSPASGTEGQDVYKTLTLEQAISPSEPTVVQKRRKGFFGLSFAAKGAKANPDLREKRFFGLVKRVLAAK